MEINEDAEQGLKKLIKKIKFLRGVCDMEGDYPLLHLQRKTYDIVLEEIKEAFPMVLLWGEWKDGN